MRGHEEATIDLMRENARLKDMVRECIRELRALDAHTVPARAENLLVELDT